MRSDAQRSAMQAAMEQVALNCGAELENYQVCVESNPNTWQIECAERKSMLTSCAAKCSGLVNSVKERCKPQIEQYERCLKANGHSPGTCQPMLEKLWACSEGVNPHSPQVCTDPNCKDC